LIVTLPAVLVPEDLGLHDNIAVGVVGVVGAVGAAAAAGTFVGEDIVGHIDQSCFPQHSAEASEVNPSTQSKSSMKKLEKRTKYHAKERSHTVDQVHSVL